MKNRKVNPKPDTAETARKAMNKRSKKNGGDPNMPYYYVLGGFWGLMVVIVLYFMLNPKESFLDKQVVDQNEFMINNLHNQMFTAGPNEQFEGYTMNEARRFFNIGISETPNMSTCPPKEDIAIPDEYDFTKDPKREHCVDKEVRSTGNCTAGHVLSVISTIEDRICIQGKEGDRFRLSAQDAISCDSSNFYCDGGYVTQALEYGTKYGYVKEECFPYEGKNTTCPVDPNQWREDKEAYHLLGYCIVQGPIEIKKEILKNGPVIAPMTPFTDFLTYKEGIYHPQESAFKFNGQQALKIVGWEQTLNGEAWIIENSWGPSWGEKGYAKVMAGIRDIGLDYIGIAPMPTGSNAADWEVESEKLRQDYAKYAEAQKAETEQVEGIEVEEVDAEGSENAE